MPPAEEEKRMLTDADISALLDQAEKRFYSNFGKGIWQILWKAMMMTALAIAAYGGYKGIK